MGHGHFRQRENSRVSYPGASRNTTPLEQAPTSTPVIKGSAQTSSLCESLLAAIKCKKILQFKFKSAGDVQHIERTAAQHGRMFLAEIAGPSNEAKASLMASTVIYRLNAARQMPFMISTRP
jgi:hypothetical protein